MERMGASFMKLTHLSGSPEQAAQILADKLWDVASGRCVNTLQRERSYEQMDITGVAGLSPAQKAMLRTLGAIEA
jgi:hypothetical protein